MEVNSRERKRPSVGEASACIQAQRPTHRTASSSVKDPPHSSCSTSSYISSRSQRDTASSSSLSLVFAPPVSHTMQSRIASALILIIRFGSSSFKVHDRICPFLVLSPTVHPSNTKNALLRSLLGALALLKAGRLATTNTPTSCALRIQSRSILHRIKHRRLIWGNFGRLRDLPVHKRSLPTYTSMPSRLVPLDSSVIVTYSVARSFHLPAWATAETHQCLCETSTRGRRQNTLSHNAPHPSNDTNCRDPPKYLETGRCELCKTP